MTRENGLGLQTHGSYSFLQSEIIIVTFGFFILGGLNDGIFLKKGFQVGVQMQNVID